MAELAEVRIDKWLWAVRLFKTRSQASDACSAGKVKIAGIAVKPSRIVKINDEIIVQVEQARKTVRVITLLDKRVGAKLVPDFMEDLTPKEELSKIDVLIKMPLVKRDRGTGRPTKKERRDIDKLYI